MLLHTFLPFTTCSMSVNENRMIILSIHQPRYSIFKLFDSLSLLSQGEIVYHGQANLALDYFDRLGTLIMHIKMSNSLFAPSKYAFLQVKYGQQHCTALLTHRHTLCTHHSTPRLDLGNICNTKIRTYTVFVQTCTVHTQSIDSVSVPPVSHIFTP